jgi:N6-L-threonylcarbamoyladenine synthase
LSVKHSIILGIESSCDDTSAAILVGNKIVSNCIANQKIHQKYGGVVPELASRAHQENIVPVVQEALSSAGISLKDIDAIACTRGPGLMGSLVVGVSFSKSLALSIGVPIIEVNHMKAHILAHFINDESHEIPKFPFICLTVSGGHTQLVKVDSPYEMEVIGTTIDDAAGEAFDKAAKMIGIDYPGGPRLDKYAELGNPHKFKFAKPKVTNLDFSFSGLKTSILYNIRDWKKEDERFVENHFNDLCASIRHTIVDILMNKLEMASKQTGIKEIAIAGGVSANSELRRRLKEKETEGWKVHIPKFEYCTDNAAMVAIAGKYSFDNKIFSNQRIAADPKLPW